MQCRQQHSIATRCLYLRRCRRAARAPRVRRFVAKVAAIEAKRCLRRVTLPAPLLPPPSQPLLARSARDRLLPQATQRGRCGVATAARRRDVTNAETTSPYRPRAMISDGAERQRAQRAMFAACSFATRAFGCREPRRQRRATYRVALTMSPSIIVTQPVAVRAPPAPCSGAPCCCHEM